MKDFKQMKSIIKNTIIGLLISTPLLAMASSNETDLAKVAQFYANFGLGFLSKKSMPTKQESAKIALLAGQKARKLLMQAGNTSNHEEIYHSAYSIAVIDAAVKTLYNSNALQDTELCAQNIATCYVSCMTSSPRASTSSSSSDFFTENTFV